MVPFAPGLVNVLHATPAFRPNSAGMPNTLAPLTLRAINDTLPALASLAEHVAPAPHGPRTLADYAETHAKGDPVRLAALFNAAGSDKAAHHDYYILYASLLAQLETRTPLRLFEIGLGTNQTDVASNMTADGRPGASLRAFRDASPEVEVVGADVDRRVLFDEPRIRTVWLDQTDPDTFFALEGTLGGPFDLMIDDGLHAMNANLHSLSFFLRNLAPGGFAVVEDIHAEALPLWRAAAAILNPRFETHLLAGRRAHVFLLRMPDP